MPKSEADVMHGRSSFGFEVTKIVPLQKEAKGSRVHVRATLGAKIFAVFHIDVVVGTAKSGEPDELPR
jgi:hypothetical protein